MLNTGFGENMNFDAGVAWLGSSLGEQGYRSGDEILDSGMDRKGGK